MDGFDGRTLMSGQKNSAGFTLVELIAVVVILSIVAVMGTQFVVSSTVNYETTRTRALLVNTGRQSLEQMSRQLRIALPYSAVTSAAGQCIKFMPIAAGGNYLADETTGSELGGAVIPVSPHAIEYGTASWVSIGALASNEIYSSSPASLAALASRTPSSLTLTAPKSWPRKSINRRFYLLNNPQAFCLIGNELRFYENQSVTTTAVDLTANFALMAENVVAIAAGPPFVLSGASEHRNALVQINLGFRSGSEQVDFGQQVMIRNVP